VYFDGVLEEEEIDLLIEGASPRFERSRVVGPDGGLVDDKSRTSSTAWLYEHDDPRYRTIKEKVTGLIGFVADQSEDISVRKPPHCTTSRPFRALCYQRLTGWPLATSCPSSQVNKYVKPPGEAGQEFRPHYDYFNDEAQLKDHKFNGCERAATLLIYLSDTIRGGETLFIRDGHSASYNAHNPSHIQVTPRRGRILAWFNCHPLTEAVDGATLHAGVAIEEGVKLAATLFVRNCTARVPRPESAAE
jgi:hypothetical protein